MRKILLALFLFAAVTPAVAQQSAQPILCNKIATASLAAGTTQIIAGIANEVITLCGWARDENANGTAQLIFGTGTGCTTSTNASANWTVLVNTHTINHVPYGFVSSAPGQSLCAVVTGTGTILNAEIYYLQTP